MANRLVEIISNNAQKHGKREAYRFCWTKNGKWKTTNWKEFAAQIDNAAKALNMMSLLEKDTIAICSPNTPQILITEFGAFNNRIAVIPLYSSSSQSQFDFIVSNGEAKVLFVGDKHQYPLAYNYWKAHKDQIRKIVIFSPEGWERPEDDDITILWDDFVQLGENAPEEVCREVNARAERGLPEDTATLIYTSGTTGEPKGVVITHSNYDAAIEEHKKFLTQIKDTDTSMAFLPMSHILEKAWCFFCMSKRIPVAINYDPRVIQDKIKEVEPNIMCCVPRFWEKVYAGVKEKISKMGPLQRMMVSRAIRVGYRRNLGFKREGKPVPSLLEKEYQFWDKKIFMQVKRAIGIPDPNFFPTAGAPLSDRICQFLHSIGIDIIIGYGLSETTATVTCFPQVNYKIGTVGIPLPNVKVKIDDSGEILVKAPTVTPGYFKNPEANATAFTEDGYFRTGDAGYLNPDGSLVLTERVKDLFKTSNGKYIAPQMLESRLAENKYIDELAVIGDQRKFVTALVVPNFSQLNAWAKKNGIDTSDPEAMCADPRTVAFVLLQINSLQKDLAPYEQIKKITLLPNHFSIMNGEVTNTMKVRRPVVAKRYAKEIEKMYAEI